MGCASSNLLNQEDELSQLGSSVLSQHIVSLTSTTYGLLNVDPPATTPPTRPQRFTLGSILPGEPVRAEVINSWELMSGLGESDNNSLRKAKENPSANSAAIKSVLERFERICPPDGENKVVIYTTTLRGIRKTYEACKAAKSVIENFGVAVSERDVSMDRGFKEELRELMMRRRRRSSSSNNSNNNDNDNSKDEEEAESSVQPLPPVLPRVFVKGRYVGGAEEVLRIVEEGWFGELIEGIPIRKLKGVCQGCADVRFFPCFRCNGSCKLVINMQPRGKTAALRCPDCNENGLVLCPLCS